jgi:hypothetical protein
VHFNPNLGRVQNGAPLRPCRGYAQIIYSNYFYMTELERIILELDLKGYKQLLDFYNWRLETEGESSEISDSIDELLDLLSETIEKLKQV